MKDDWTIQRLGDLRAKTKHAFVGGPFGSNLVSSDYTDEGVPVIRGCNLPSKRSFSFDDLVFVSEKKADSLRQNTALPGDLIFTQRGTLGQIGLIPKDSTYPRFIVSQSQMKLTVDPEKADTRYLYYYFSLPSTVEMIHNLAISSGVPHINLDILRKFQVITPPVAVQNKIAAILSSYDELIENNNRRIALLERLAEEIYREWFVRFRFPGHETAQFIKGVPGGWLAKRFSDVCTFQKGKTPDEIFDEKRDDCVPYIKVDFLEGNNTEYVLKKRNSIVAEDGDVLMLMDGSRSGLVFRAKEGVVGSTLARVQVEPQLRDFVFEFLKASRESIVSNNTGSAIPHANKEFINRLILFLPPDNDILVEFNGHYSKIYGQMVNLQKQKEYLTKTRDLLLPRLISGRLSVDDLDIQFPPGMVGEKSETV